MKKPDDSDSTSRQYVGTEFGAIFIRSDVAQSSRPTSKIERSGGGSAELGALALVTSGSKTPSRRRAQPSCKEWAGERGYRTNSGRFLQSQKDYERLN